VTFPRLRIDQLQQLCWLVLVPLALGQLVLTAAVRLVM
jgi:NADH-quinone oxidoreductase subunit H